MKNYCIKAVLIMNYFIFAILLNSVGTVILQVQQNFEITKPEASILEGFKDLPIAICSFLLASILPRIGIKRSMLIALLFVSIMCFIMPFATAFWYFKLLFSVVGISFALIKISVFTAIGIITNNEKEHTSFMGFIEGFFMVGVLVGNIMFSLFINDYEPKSTAWLTVYWILGILSSISFLFLTMTPLDERGIKTENNSIKDDLKNNTKLFKLKRVLLFLACTFLFVLVEQSFQTWTPTFYKEILKLPTSMAIQGGAILAGAFALGRFLCGFFARRFKWIYIITFCIVGFSLSIILILPLTEDINIETHTNWLNAPLPVYMFPLMGVFLAPIYPSINSVILASVPKYMQSSMAGLIVVFSAIGGTIGSILTGSTFQLFSGQTAFYLCLVPLVLLLISAIALNKQILILKKP